MSPSTNVPLNKFFENCVSDSQLMHDSSASFSFINQRLRNSSDRRTSLATKTDSQQPLTINLSSHHKVVINSSFKIPPYFIKGVNTQQQQQAFYGPLSRTTRVSRYQPNLFCCSTKIMSSITSLFLSLNSLLGTLSFTSMSHIHLTILTSAR